MIINFILIYFLTKDPDQAENVEEDGVIMNVKDADQHDCGAGEESDQPSYAKEDCMIKVIYEI